MMLSPKRTKYRKSFLLYKKNPKIVYKNTLRSIFNGKLAIQSCESFQISSQRIEATRRAISRKMLRSGAIIVKIFPDIPITKKPAEVRMGKGKGNVHGWVTNVHKGQILFEINGTIGYSQALQVEKIAAHKLGLKTRLHFRM